ncbi:EthD domain-containing protein [Zhongshania arctica]|uniref:EthD domain-containing protein n=1 Tax=Zhongshania arctica TaxID=3238302 RepID=A0ABV3TXB2_9GAMM
MRKVIYLLWLDTSDEGWSRTLHHDLVPALQQVVGVGRVQLNIADGDVAPAAALRMQSSASLFDAMCCVWLDDALATDSLDELIQRISVQFSRYHVDEVERLANIKHRAETGVRTPGFSQVALLRCPQRLEYQAWLSYWQNTHTAIALETQSTFRYVQNIVSDVNGKDAAAYHAIVEECFPSLAMTDPAVFYDAVGDSSKQENNMQKMINSCVNFIDFDEIDVVPTSEYCY